MPKNYHIFLKGEVGSTWSGNFTSDMVNWILDKHKDSEVKVLINSLGGYTDEGLSISSLFKIHGNVHVHFIGQSASAATIAAMGAKKISIDADAMFLVHRCSSIVFEWASMNTEQIDEFIKNLEKRKQNQSITDNVVANLYAKRCKKSKDELLQLMSKDTWLTAQEALDWGFVDEITDDADDKQTISESTMAAMSSAGIPLPPGYKGKKGPLISRFFEFLRSSNSNDDTDRIDNAQNITLNPQNNNQMESNSTQDQQQDVAPQNVSQQSAAADLNQPQQSATADSTESEKDLEIKSLKEQLAKRDETIAQLKQQPASSTSDVIDSKKDTADKYAPVSYEEGLKASKDFIEKFS